MKPSGMAKLMQLLPLLAAAAALSMAQGIYYKSTTREFHLVGKSSLYAFYVGAGGGLVHLHWGHLDPTVVSSGAAANLPSLVYIVADTIPTSFDPTLAIGINETYNGPVSRNAETLEWSNFGSGDFRFPSFDLRYVTDGSRIAPMQYRGHEIFAGKPNIDPSQPAFYVEQASEAESLRIDLIDPLTDLRMELWYTVYKNYDAITRRAVVVNSSPGPVQLRAIMSATVDLPTAKSRYTLTHLAGAWARERLVVTDRLRVGTKSIQSRRGASSHQHNPFIIVSDGPYSEQTGEHFAFSLVYAGGFLANAEMVQTGHLRINMGIDPMTFEWNLARDASFVAPEVALVYSNSGIGQISRQLHTLMRSRLVRGYFRDRPRPTLVNSWEAMYFDVNEEKIIQKLAIPAADLGIQLVVLDDGWFGERNNDRSSLGDWYPNPAKFPDGLAGTANRVIDLGLQFGIWMEPEMISADSNLYRAHPDWPLHVGQRPRTESRNQLVLDLSRPDVRDFIVQAVTDVLNSANISYLKWDFNRHLTEVGSSFFDASIQGEIYHRFVLGVYDIMERLTTAFPRVLFESCSGGGGRFDPALLYYMPQVWTSDNTDAVARLKMQYGTSLAYPASAMSAHVTKSPNEQNGRTTSMVTRGRVALGGVFGYELDLTSLSSQDQQLVREQIAVHARIENIVRTGDVYRLASPYEEDPQQPRLAAWMHVLPDRSRAAVFVFNSDYYELVWNNARIALRGLDPLASYRLTSDNGAAPFSLPGSVLMSTGLPVLFSRDGSSMYYELTRLA